MSMYGSPNYGFNGTNYNLSVYGQTQGTGRLEISNACPAVHVKNFNFYGGTLSIDCNASSDDMINVSENCNILGGKVSIEGAYNEPNTAIKITNGTLTLGYRNSDDYISFVAGEFGSDGSITVTESESSGSGTVQIADGQTIIKSARDCAFSRSERTLSSSSRFTAYFMSAGGGSQFVWSV